MRAIRQRLHGDSGASVVETIIVMILLGVLGTLLVSVMTNSLRLSRTQMDRTLIMNDTKSAFERTGQDLRGANPVLTAQPDRLRLEVVTPTTKRLVTYSVTGAGSARQLVKAESTTVLATGVTTVAPVRVVLSRLTSSDVFSYASADGTATPVLATPSASCVGTTACHSTSQIDVITMTVSVDQRESATNVELQQEISVRNREKP